MKELLGFSGYRLEIYFLPLFIDIMRIDTAQIIGYKHQATWNGKRLSLTYLFFYLTRTFNHNFFWSTSHSLVWMIMIWPDSNVVKRNKSRIFWFIAVNLPNGSDYFPVNNIEITNSSDTFRLFYLIEKISLYCQCLIGARIILSFRFSLLSIIHLCDQ